MIVQCKHTTALLMQLEERRECFFSRVSRMFETLIMSIWNFIFMKRHNFSCFIHSQIHSFICLAFWVLNLEFEWDRHWANLSIDTFAFNELICFFFQFKRFFIFATASSYMTGWGIFMWIPIRSVVSNIFVNALYLSVIAFNSLFISHSIIFYSFIYLSDDGRRSQVASRKDEYNDHWWNHGFSSYTVLQIKYSIIHFILFICCICIFHRWYGNKWCVCYLL